MLRRLICIMLGHKWDPSSWHCARCGYALLVYPWIHADFASHQGKDYTVLARFEFGDGIDVQDGETFTLTHTVIMD